MTVARWAAGLAALTTAMLLQATLVGPLLFPLPASLPLVVIASIALLTGPSTGITLGFAGGLLADLGSAHPVGVLALTWLAVGTSAGVVGGMVTMLPGAGASARRQGRSRSRGRSRRRSASRTREQALFVGLLAGAGAIGTALLLTLINSGTEQLGTALVQSVPAAVLDAILACAVIPVVAAALRSRSLRAPAAVEPRRERMPAPMDVR